MIDVYCKDGKCPICRSKMILKDRTAYSIRQSCSNKCYTIDKVHRHGSYHRFYIFGSTLTIHRSEKEDYQISKIEKISKRIAYWKENDRYLAEILERN